MEATNSPSSATPATALDAAHQELAQDTLRGVAGPAAAERYADRVDTLLQRLFFEASPAASPVAVLALGGYGRRHLTLHSDVDVLVLFEGPIGADEERFVRGFLHPLWDLHLVVGHQVATSPISRGSKRTIRNFCWRCWMLDGSSATRRCTAASSRSFTGPRPTPPSWRCCSS